MMPRVGWLTDIHLNFLSLALVGEFVEELSHQQVDAWLISGDIGESNNLVTYLKIMVSRLPQPIYFVLGNHDFYWGSIKSVRDEIQALCQYHPNLHYLSAAEWIELTPTVGLVGHDGWADLQFGNFATSDVMMNDYVLIQELVNQSKAGLPRETGWLANEAAYHFRRVLPQALARFPHVLAVTHVPPFQEACWHDNQISDDNWLPHFTCKAVGDVLRETMLAHPNQQLTVLCGHTHGKGEAQILPNLQVLTGGAEYGNPTLQQVFDFTPR
ncbi:MAG: metallophosphoesterase [Chloroflexi bacterium]|nr:metallophosphoesterase [Chloroflexota bacterium]